MKKIKMMLLSLALFAVVGGALAFKARFQTDFCTAPTEQGVACTQIACANHAISKIDPKNQADFVCTTTYDQNGCASENLLCTTTTLRLTPDNQ